MKKLFQKLKGELQEGIFVTLYGLCLGYCYYAYRDSGEWLHKICSIAVLLLLFIGHSIYAEKKYGRKRADKKRAQIASSVLLMSGLSSVAVVLASALRFRFLVGFDLLSVGLDIFCLTAAYVAAKFLLNFFTESDEDGDLEMEEADAFLDCYDLAAAATTAYLFSDHYMYTEINKETGEIVHKYNEGIPSPIVGMAAVLALSGSCRVRDLLTLRKLLGEDTYENNMTVLHTMFDQIDPDAIKLALEESAKAGVVLQATPDSPLFFEEMVACLFGLIHEEFDKEDTPVIPCLRYIANQVESEDSTIRITNQMFAEWQRDLRAGNGGKE